MEADLKGSQDDSGGDRPTCPSCAPRGHGVHAVSGGEGPTARHDSNVVLSRDERRGTDLAEPPGAAAARVDHYPAWDQELARHGTAGPDTAEERCRGRVAEPA